MEDVIEFTARYSWLFNFKVTDFFLGRVWDNAPSEWLESLQTWSYEDLRGAPFGKQQVYWPDSLKDFISTCLEYSVSREMDSSGIDALFIVPGEHDILGIQSNSTVASVQKFATPGSGKCMQSNSTVAGGQEKAETPVGQGTPETGYSDTHNVTIGKPTAVDEVHVESSVSDDGGITDTTLHEVLNTTVHRRMTKKKLNDSSIDKGITDKMEQAASSGTERMTEAKINNITDLSIDKGKTEKEQATCDTKRLTEAKINDKLDPSIRKGMTDKKFHEVCKMASMIDTVACKSGARCVVDVGSGLGYLGQVLHNVYGYEVLGLEGKQSHTTGAEKRAVQKNTNVCPGLQNRTCELYENRESETHFTQVLSDWLTNLPPEDTQVCSCKSGTRHVDAHFKSGRDSEKDIRKPAVSIDNVIEANSKEGHICDKCIKMSNAKKGLAKGRIGGASYLGDNKDKQLGIGPCLCSSHSKQCDESVYSSDKHAKSTNLSNSELHLTGGAEVDTPCLSPNQYRLGMCSTMSQEKHEHLLSNDFQHQQRTSSSGLFDTQPHHGDTNWPVKHSGQRETHQLPHIPGQTDLNQLHSISSSGLFDTQPQQTDTNWPVKHSGERETHQLPNIPGQTDLNQLHSISSSGLFNTQPQQTDTNWPVKHFGHREAHKLPNIPVQMEDSSGLTDFSQSHGISSSTSSISSGICMVGLHCCGDLTPTMLKYFTKMDFIKSLCVVSCCYHRMGFDEEQSKCKNFPLSLRLKKCLTSLQSRYPAIHFSPYSLRLAAQETRARWRQQTMEDHAYHTRNVAFRGILEVCLASGTFVMKKTSRKIVHKNDCNAFDSYIKTVSKHIHIPQSELAELHIKSFEDRMQRLYKEYEPYFVYIEPITALQFLLQPVLETLIYNDRVCWLQEQGIQASIVPVFDEFVSPRNLALVAVKA